MNLILKRFFLYITLIFTILFLIIFLINYYVLSFSYEGYYSNVSDLGEYETGIVFGASVKNNKTPSSILKDRLDVAFEAYKQGKIKKILVSGDNSQTSYNEPLVMRNYLIKLGVKKHDIYEDFAGFDTYDSLYRAIKIFKVDKLVLFTQDFHLKRALYIAKKLGLQVVGVQTSLGKNYQQKYNYYREIFARIKAFIEVEITKPEPKYLGDSVKIVSDDEIDEAKESLIDESESFSGNFDRDFN